MITEWEKQKVIFVETTKVAAGVECDAYKFADDNSRDLGIIRVNAGFKTPRQLVVMGERTIEGFISGSGKLIIESNGHKQEYAAQNGMQVLVGTGQIMQWRAADANLEVYEICYPPYEPGRFKNLS